MKDVNDLPIKWKNILKKLGQGKFVIVVIIVGLFLLLLPDTDKKAEEEMPDATYLRENYSVEALEQRLEESLSKMENAGRVEVILSVERGVRYIYAQDENIEQKNGETQQSKKTVVVSTGSGTEETVLIQQIYPKFQGAIVIASGGDDPAVKYRLTEAIAAFTGLGSDKISVCKGK